MHQSRGGMGSSKHRKSGHPAKNARYKALSQREAQVGKKPKVTLESTTVRDLLRRR